MIKFFLRRLSDNSFYTLMSYFLQECKERKYMQDWDNETEHKRQKLLDEQCSWAINAIVDTIRDGHNFREAVCNIVRKVDEESFERGKTHLFM